MGLTDNEKTRFDLALFDREAAAYDSAREHFARELHRIMADIDALLRDKGFFDPTSAEPSGTHRVKLPSHYEFGWSKPQGASKEFGLYYCSGRSKDLVLSATLYEDRSFSFHLEDWYMPTLKGDLKDGFLEHIVEYANASKKVRAEMLKSKALSWHDEPTE